MACADCCSCLHEPPPTVSAEEQAWAERLAGILGNRPTYTRRNSNRVRVSLSERSSGIGTLKEGSGWRAQLTKGRWTDRDNRVFDHDAIAVKLEFYSLAPETAEIVLGALAIAQGDVELPRTKRKKKIRVTLGKRGGR